MILKFNEFNEKKRIIGYYIGVMDNFIRVIEASAGMAGVMEKEGLVDKTVAEFSQLRANVDLCRQKAWEDWSLYNDELMKMQDSMNMGDDAGFAMAELRLTSVLENTENYWAEIGLINESLVNIYGGVQKVHKNNHEANNLNLQPGEED